jgi:hypothetical protein
MDFIEDNPKAFCYIITTIVGLAIIVAGMVWSAGTVEPIEYGLKYNKFSKTVDSSSVYSGGWYLIGPFNSFISFPSTNENIDFADYAKAQSAPL